MKNVKGLRSAVMLSLLAAASVVWGGTPVFAAAEVPANDVQAIEEVDLDEMVVTATRTEAKKVDVPVNTTVVTAEKIESRHYQNVAEALKDVPGASVIDTGVGVEEKKIVLNGDARVLILVDGKRVSYDMGVASGRANYDMNQLPDISIIDRIEVVKGHGGALYGSDAVGGVVNIITKKMDHTYGKVAMGFGSHQARDAKAMYSIKEGKTGVMVSASKYKQGYITYKDAADHNTKRLTNDTDYQNEKVSLKIAQELSETSNLEVAYDFSKLSGTNTRGNYFDVAPLLDKKSNNFNVKYDWMINDTDQGYVQVYRNKYEFITHSSIEEIDTGFDAQQAITLADNNKLVVGASYRNAKGSNDGRNEAAKYNETINNKALFVSDQWEFVPTWTLDAGVRYDNHSKAGGRTTWSAGLNKKFDENSHAYFNWGQVFKAPTLDDLFYDAIDSYGNMTKGNLNLKPEKGDTWTLGYGTKINDKTDINVSYFQSTLENAIVWDWWSTYGVTQAKNIDKQKKNGLELSINHELNDNWDVEASYSYVRVRNNKNDGNGYVRDAGYVPNIYRLGVRYHNDLWNADMFLRAGSGADTTTAASWPSDHYYVDSSYVTLDAAVSYKATKALSFYAKGYNLLNRAYAESAGAKNGSYNYPAQGRRFIVGAEYTF